VGHEWQPLSNIYIVRAFTAHAVLHTLDQLRHSLSSGQASPQLLVIDSLGGVIGPLVGAGKTRGHEYMMNVIREIKALAFEFEIAVLVSRKHNTHRSSCCVSLCLSAVFLIFSNSVFLFQTTNYTVSSGHDKARETAMDPSQPSLMPALGTLARVELSRQGRSVVCDSYLLPFAFSFLRR
jgi:hypothetical protein